MSCASLIGSERTSIESRFVTIYGSEFDLAEALRWCWRHRAVLDFDDIGEGSIITLVTPLRRSNDPDRVTVICRTQALVEDTVLEMISKTRERTNLE